MYYYDIRIASWVLSIAGGVLSIGVLGFAVRDLIRPAVHFKNISNAAAGNPYSNLRGPLKGVIIGLIFAILRTVALIITLSGRVVFFELTYITGFFNLCVHVIAFLSLVRVTRRFRSHISSKDSELGDDGAKIQAKPHSNKSLFDYAVIGMLGILGLTSWAFDLGNWLHIMYGKGYRQWYPKPTRDASKALAIMNSVWLIITAIYISLRLLSKRRKAKMVGAGAGADAVTDIHARVTFTLKVIPTMAFVSVIRLISTFLQLFLQPRNFIEYTQSVGQADRAFQILNLIGAWIGEVLLLEFSRGALRRLARG
ncbi:hypothetical protein QBC43DRAFT_366192 [Cladorrhinum sp. PSN259]|nr:hypothetical protein QBC43DRAFT_366192 [Cladorrhinum sp. PSN259]